MGYPRAPRGWKDAIATAQSYAANGRRTQSGMCLRETRQYYGVPAKYPAAKDSLAAAQREGKAYRIHNWNKVPKGAIVYWFGGGSKYGHIAISVGKGYVISTDIPSAGRYGRIHGAQLMRAWGYTRAYWSPLVNDYRVWPRYDLYGRPKRAKRWGPVNRFRVNRALRGGRIDKVTRRQMNRVVWAGRAQRGKAFAKGYAKRPRASLRRAIRKFQQHQGWRGNDADGLIGPETGRRLKHLKQVFYKKVK